MYDSDPHVYMSLADIKESQHDEDSSLPSDNLPNQVSSTVSPTYILEALCAPIPPELIPNPVVQLPPPNFASTVPWPIYSTAASFNKYEPQPTDGLPETVGIRSLDILGHAAVDDAGTYLVTTHLPT